MMIWIVICFSFIKKGMEQVVYTKEQFITRVTLGQMAVTIIARVMMKRVDTMHVCHCK